MEAELTQAVETVPEGTPSAPGGETAPVSAPADDSLAAHEAAHSPLRDAPERDEETGKFAPKGRRRAQSQQADADDVPAINEQTKRLKALEEAHGKDIVRKPGESERVYNLRRRADLIERGYTRPEPQAAAPTPQPAPRPSQPLAQSFPAYEAFVAMPGYENATYEDYTDARADWRFAIRREQERQQDAAERQQREFSEKATTHQQRVTAAKKTYADWDSVVSNDLPISRVVHDAVLGSQSSADVQYYLGQHRDMLAQLNAESQDYSPSAVAAMRRYLDSLVAAPQRTSPSSRAAAGTTGSALALAPPPAPRPPNPVRTGAVIADDPPDDSSQSLAAHEKHFGRSRR